MQFDVEYDSSLIAIRGSASRSSLRNLYYDNLSFTNKRFIPVGANQNGISARSVTDFFVSLAPTALRSQISRNAVPRIGERGLVNVQGTSGFWIGTSGILSMASLSSAAASSRRNYDADRLRDWSTGCYAT